MCCFFCFKHKTAYEMRISDWSSDVCSSDLPDPACARTSHLLLSFETTSGGSSWLIPHLAALHPAASIDFRQGLAERQHTVIARQVERPDRIRIEIVRA